LFSLSSLGVQTLANSLGSAIVVVVANSVDAVDSDVGTDTPSNDVDINRLYFVVFTAAVLDLAVAANKEEEDDEEL